jgi:preprotein translocase subunit SecG
MVLLQDSKKGMSQALTGSNSDNFYQKNSGRSKEAQLGKATRTAAILFFIVTLVVNVFAIYFKDETPAPPADGLDPENIFESTMPSEEELDEILRNEFGIEPAEPTEVEPNPNQPEPGE